MVLSQRHGGQVAPSEHKAEASVRSWPENPCLQRETRITKLVDGEVTGPAGGTKGVLCWLDPEIYLPQTWLRPDRERYTSGRFVLKPRLNRSQRGH
jgi:hypothetical protein